MKNTDDKVTINFRTTEDFYDLYVNGLNVVASGTLYLTGDEGLLETETAILVDGVDSGKTGVEFDFDVIDEFSIKINQFQPYAIGGELDFIFVNNGELNQLSELYDYSYMKINVTTSNGY